MTVRITRDDNWSIADQIGRLTGKKPGGHDPEVRKLRGQVVTTYALIKSGLPELQFGKKYADPVLEGRPVRRSNLEKRWVNGSGAPGPRKIKAMDADIPGVSDLNGHPLFPLLQDLPLSLKFIRHQLSRYTHDTVELGIAWRFADEAERLSTETVVPIITRNDVINLVHRCDLDGLTVILGLVREAEVMQNTHLHMHRMHHLYRSLPAVLALPWFRPHVTLLKERIERVHVRDHLSFMFLKPHWDRIESLAIPESAEKNFCHPIASMKLWRERETQNDDVVEMAEPRFRSESIFWRGRAIFKRSKNSRSKRA